jgi:hypothetical protein
MSRTRHWKKEDVAGARRVCLGVVVYAFISSDIGKTVGNTIGASNVSGDTWKSRKHQWG